MIIVDIYGGLGNQMFQYAFGKKISVLKNTELQMEVSSFKNYQLRDYLLKHFNITGLVITNKADSYKIHNKYLNFFVKKLKRIGINVVPSMFIERKEFFFDESALKSNAVYYEGYWQSYKYFENIRNVLLREFSLNEELNEENKEILKIIKNSDSISLHIRRGDYVNNPKVQNANLSLKYYLDAISYINTKVKNPKYFIFSDDIDWVKENLKFENEKIFVDINDGNTPHFDLELMKNCKHNIIANSTFSWWGAWLNGNANKIVVSPSIWMKYNVDINEVIPPSWIIIKA